MSRFKNTKLRCDNIDYTTKQLIGQGGFSYVFTTDNPKVICKIQIISIPQINQSYQTQKQIYLNVKHNNLVKLVGAVEINNKDEKLGVLLLEACKNGNLFNFLEKANGGMIEEQIIYEIAFEIISAIEALHNQNIAHRDIKLENILLNSDNQWKLCDFGSATKNIITKIDKSNRVAVQQEMQKKTTPLYRSPQQLDLYSNFEIGLKVDIFALGCVIFMLCFQKQPFESKLASINTQYFLPQKHPYSLNMIGLINLCFTPNPAYRPTSTQLKSRIIELTNVNKSKTDKSQLLLDTDKQYQPVIESLRNFKQTKDEDKAGSSSLMDKMKRLYSQMTTQTAGWIQGFIQQSDQAPNLKYNRSILSKCWEKRYKVQKVYSILEEQVTKHADKPLVIIKILLLLHNFIRKGPPEAISNKQVSNIFAKIFNKWKFITNSDINQSKRKSGIIIQCYSLLAFMKVVLCRKYVNFIQGNYSPTPFFTKRKQSKILNFQFLDDLLKFLQNVVAFHQVMLQTKYYPKIKQIILLSLIDQQYCLISFYVHLYCALKQSTNFLKGQINQQQFRLKVNQTNADFKIIYSRLVQIFNWSSKNYQSFRNNKIQLNEMVMFYVDGLQMFKQKQFIFDITDYLNFQTQIYGLKLPESYQGVLKNLNDWKKEKQDFIEYNQFRKKQSEIKNNQKPNLINSIKNNFFEKGDDNMEFSHQSINKDFGDNEKMEQLRKSRVSFKADNTSLHNLVNAHYFEATKKDSRVEYGLEQKPLKATYDQGFKFLNRQPNVESRIVYHVEQQPKLQSINPPNPHYLNSQYFPPQSMINSQYVSHMPKYQLQYSASNMYVASKDPGIITFDDQPNDFQIKEGLQNIISAPAISSMVFGQMSKPQVGSINNHSSVVNSITFQDIQLNISPQSIRIQSTIFQNYFYKVSKAVLNEIQDVVVKQLNNGLQKRNQTLQHIVKNYELKPHINVASFIGISKINNKLVTVQQYCEGQTLYDILHNSSATFSWDSRISIAKQIAQALMFLHYSLPQIVHRSLCSKNIKFTYPFTDNKSTKIKLTQYGLDLPISQILQFSPLSIPYIAPQIFNDYNYSLKTDIYSFSIVLWQLISRRIPYTQQQNIFSLMKQIDQQRVRPDIQWISQKCPNSLKQLMMRCWHADPFDRPDIKQIVSILNQIKMEQ